MSAALGLFRLQQVDSQVSQIEARLAKIRAVLENDEDLNAALAQAEEADAKQGDLERVQRKWETEAQSQQIKIQQAESSLYGGSVRNPKELQDLQSDIASLKKHLALLEENELEAMIQTESAQENHKNTLVEVDKIKARLGDEHRQLIEEKDALMPQLDRLHAEREATVRAVAANMLTLYEGLRHERRGMAVAEISDNACRACGTTLTAALQQSARSASQIVHCPSCGRILYAV